MATVLRPLSTGELLDRTFSLYRTHFALFVGIFSVPYLCVFAYRCLGLAYQSPGASISNALSTLGWAWGAILLSMVVSAAAHAATVVAVSNVYLDRPASVLDSYSKVKGKILSVIGLSLSVGFLVGLACIALVVPGILLAIRWSLGVPAMVLEDKGVGDSMSRSSELTKGNRGRVFVIWILFIVLAVGVGLLLQWPVEFASGVSGKAGLRTAPLGWQLASLIAAFFSECLVGPLATIAFSLVYYDERVRKEAFDLQLMMTTLDAPALQGSLA